MIEDIDNYVTIGGLKMKYPDWRAKICNQSNICAKKQGYNIFTKASALGITDDEILNVFEFLNRARVESTAQQSEDKDIELLNFYWLFLLALTSLTLVQYSEIVRIL